MKECLMQKETFSSLLLFLSSCRKPIFSPSIIPFTLFYSSNLSFENTSKNLYKEVFFLLFLLHPFLLFLFFILPIFLSFLHSFFPLSEIHIFSSSSLEQFFFYGYSHTKKISTYRLKNIHIRYITSIILLDILYLL